MTPLFNILISVLNMLSFCVSIGVFIFGSNAAYVKLQHDVYGVSPTSLLGYWILLGGIPVFAATYLVVSRKSTSTRNRGFAVCLVEFVAIVASLPNFLPFFNIIVLGWGSFYAFMTGLITICYYHEFSLRLDDTQIAVAAKVERVKLEFET